MRYLVRIVEDGQPSTVGQTDSIRIAVAMMDMTPESYILDSNTGAILS